MLISPTVESDLAVDIVDIALGKSLPAYKRSREALKCGVWWDRTS